MSAVRIGEILVRQGILRPDQLTQALEEAQRTGLRLGQAIVNLGYLKETQLLKVLEKIYSKPSIDLTTYEFDREVVRMVPRDFCEKHCLIPISKAASTLVVAFADPTNLNIQDQLRLLTKVSKIQPVVSTEGMITTALDRFHEGTLAQARKGISDEEDSVEIMTTAAVEVNDRNIDDGPIVKFVNSVMVEAIRKRASDIHFEPYEKKFRVRFRIDGMLVEQTNSPPGSAAAISSRVKIMAKMDISEKRRPQDGRIKIKTSSGREMDFRVNSIPTMWGEKIVMRLLDKSSLQLDMTRLGFEEDDLRLFKQMIHLPQGMTLITGPTGSGKTTTIYSALAELNQADVNISTAEDPIEFNLEGINQMQVNPDIDLTFAEALRSFLRQDPDIIMVGEIRDFETAEISFKAASTGHMVLSTLHTNDAPSTIARLIEMGVAPYLMTSTVNLIVAQRLVGRICDNCKTQIQVPEQSLLNLGVVPAEIPEYKIFKGLGCTTCNNTGIRGRLAIYEMMPMTEKIKVAILKGATQGQLRYLCREMGMKTLRRSALLKLKRGLTTIEEVLNASVKDI